MAALHVKGDSTALEVRPAHSKPVVEGAVPDPSTTTPASAEERQRGRSSVDKLEVGDIPGRGLTKKAPIQAGGLHLGFEADPRWTQWISQVGVGGCHVISDESRGQVELELKAMTRQQRQALASALERRPRPGGIAPSVDELLDWLGRGVAPPGRRPAPPHSDPNEPDRSKRRVGGHLLDDAEVALRIAFAAPSGSHPRSVSEPLRLPWGEIRVEVQLTHGAKLEFSAYRGHVVVKSSSVPGARQKPTIYVDQTLVGVDPYGSHPRNPASMYSDGFTFPFVSRFEAKGDTRIDVVVDGEHVVLDGRLRVVDSDPTPTVEELAKLEKWAKERSSLPEDAGRSLSGEGLRTAIRASGKQVIAFSGFATAGFRDPARVEEMIRGILSAADPRTSCVLTGGTDDGIGIASRIAKELGFSTFALRSLKGANRAISSTVDHYAYSGRTWCEAAKEFGELVGQGLLVALGGNAFTVAEGEQATAAGAQVVALPGLPDARGNVPGLLTFLMDQAAAKAPDHWLILDGFPSQEELAAAAGKH